MCKDKFHTINKLYLMFLMLSFLGQHAKKGLQTLAAPYQSKVIILHAPYTR